MMTKAQAISTAAARIRVMPYGTRYVVETYSPGQGSEQGAWDVSDPMNYWAAQRTAWEHKVSTALELLGIKDASAETVMAGPGTRADGRREDWRRAVYRILEQQEPKKENAVVSREGHAMTTASEYLKRPYGRLLVPDDEGGYRAEIIEFPGCFAEGETAAEAASNLEDAAHSWLEATLAKGQTVPEPMEELDYSGKLVVRLPKSLHRQVAFASNREGVSLNQFIVSSIAEQIGGSRWGLQYQTWQSKSHVIE